MLITGPADLREQMRPLPTGQLLRALSRLRPGTDLSSPSTATKMALRSLARRHLTLTEELTELNTALTELATRAAPGLLAKPGVGIDVASQLLVTAGDNPERLRSEASFAHLTGVAPIPASSGRTHRHRLNRGGGRPGREQRPAHRGPGADEIRRPHPRLRPPTNRRRTIQKGHNALPQESNRPRDLPRNHSPRSRRNRCLTSVGASPGGSRAGAP